MAWEKALGGWKLTDALKRVVVEVSERLARNGSEAAELWEKIENDPLFPPEKSGEDNLLIQGCEVYCFGFHPQKTLQWYVIAPILHA